MHFLKGIIISTIIIFPALIFSQNSWSADHRSFCKRYMRNTHLGTCMDMQSAAETRLTTGVYSDVVAENCLARNKITYKSSYYYNYAGADVCAAKEQRRVDEENQLQAEAGRDRAAERYLNEAAKTEKARREYYRRNH